MGWSVYKNVFGDDHKKKLVGVYSIFNRITHKHYVGSSKDIYGRWKWHIRSLTNGDSTCKKLQLAWNKYGRDSFIFSIIELCEASSRLELETITIRSFDSVMTGYNICPNGLAPMEGRTHTEDTKKKFREWIRPAFNELQYETVRRPRSEETRNKIRQALKGRRPSDACISACIEATKDREWTEEQRKKAGEITSKRWEDPEYRERMTKMAKSHTHTQETKNKISANNIGKNKGKILSEEHKAKLKESTRLRWERYRLLKND